MAAAAGAAAGSTSVTVMYKGYVYADTKVPTARPGIEQIKRSHDQMLKKNIKETRQEHPLFVRGFDKTKLNMEISPSGVCVILPADKKTAEQCLMNQPLHRIAYCAAIAKNVYIMLKRAGSGAKDGKYKCHGFVSASDADAIELCKLLSRVTNEAFARLRHVTRLLEAKKRAALKKKPDVVARKVTVDFEQPWFHGKLSRPEAEKMLLGASATNGLFLVRQSERSETDFALSFSYNKRCYHNRIMQDATGIFKNTKGTSWGSLSLMVADYGSPHEDMQTIITEYVGNKPVGTDEEGAPSYMNVALVQDQARALKEGNKFSMSDVKDALSEIGTGNEGPGADGDIAYDPIYDDNRFGFGDDFIQQTLGLMKGGMKPAPEMDLDNVMFSCGEIDGEADC
eukprot:m.216235 g.216235  ORF g.216235 m.216235 type:complete len:397 (-) comp25640_c0_seq1:3105-4295(-)